MTELQDLIKAKTKEFSELITASLTKEQFLTAFKEVVSYLKRMEQKLNLEIGNLENKYTSIVNSIKDNSAEDITSLKQQAMNYCETELGKITKQVDKKLTEIRDGHDGIDASVEEAASKASILAQDALKPLIPTIDAIEQDLPKLGEKIRDGLELLQGDERLDKSAIKGLDEEFKRLEEVRGRVLGGGGGFNRSAMVQYFVDNEIPVDSGDHLVFSIAHEPSPASSFKLYRSRARQNITEDYTLVGKVLTLTVAFDSANESLFCDYLR